MSGDALVLLHGFTGSSASWRAVVERLPGRRLLVPDLPGHGSAAIDPGAGFEALVDGLARQVAEAGFAGARVAGYSMGGRVALALLVRHPGLFAGGVLIGASPGLADAGERARRRAEDAEWSRLLHRDGIDAFAAAWGARPLFASQGRLAESDRAGQEAIRRGHDPRRLAAALDALGLGAMPDYRPRLGTVRVPVILAAGERDPKFLALAREMLSSMPAAQLAVVAGAGHNVVLEQPAAVAGLLGRSGNQAPERDS